MKKELTMKGMTRNYGFIPPVIVKGKDFIVGDGNIVSEILQPDGRWIKYLPSEEMQSGQELDTGACATFGTFNGIETIIARRYGEVVNYSDRLTAKLTGTREKGGNDPHFVAEHIRNSGAASEADWPFVDDFEGYWADPPNSILEIMAKFLDEYTFKHAYVEDKSPEALMEILKYSPLGVSVPAWFQNSKGLYYRPKGQGDTHWCLLVGYEKGEYWIIFDTYDKTIKKYDWNSSFEFAKRYHVIRKDVATLTPAVKKSLILEKTRLLAKILTLWIANWGRPQKPAPVVPAPVTPEPVKPAPAPANNILSAMCLAIQEHEDYVKPGGKYRNGKVAPEGSISFRNANPGNIRCMPGNEANWNHLAAGSRSGFCIFPDYATGFQALKNQILSVAKGKSPTYNDRAKKLGLKDSSMLTLQQYFNIYAPVGDNNDPVSYAKAVAKKMGVNKDQFLMKELA